MCKEKKIMWSCWLKIGSKVVFEFAFVITNKDHDESVQVHFSW